MPKVRIKSEGGLTPTRRTNLLKTLCQHDIRIVKLLDATDSYIAITETDECINTIFEEATQNALSIEGFTPILSPEKRAKLILVFKRLEREILEQPEDAIKRAVEERAPFATVDNIC